MRKLRNLMVAIIVMCALFCNLAYAKELSWDSVTGNHGNSILLPESETMASDEYRTIARGDFLSLGVTQISNGQNGTIIVDIDTYAHFGVDRIFHTVFLDQWDEENEDWIMLDHWDFVKSKEEEADGELNTLFTSFTLTGYETGKYYRVRGLHGAEYNDEVEACATETDGVLLTDRS